MPKKERSFQANASACPKTACLRNCKEIVKAEPQRMSRGKWGNTITGRRESDPEGPFMFIKERN